MSTDAGGDGPPELETGRYLYCLVRADDSKEFETTGIDDEPVSVITADGVGAVVHPCTNIYDSADIGEIKRWLVTHQSVVDEAADRFGTPVPFQFDTILRGDDAAVRSWLEREHDRLRESLESLAGHWEYRVDVRRTEPLEPAAIAAEDEQLTALEVKIERATEGTAFLLEKQYDQRLAAVRRQRQAERTRTLVSRLETAASAVQELETEPAATLEEKNQTDAGGETVCRLTLLARAEAEGAIGSILDDVAANPGLEVRFTGPWPPYTFAPKFGERENEKATGGPR